MDAKQQTTMYFKVGTILKEHCITRKEDGGPIDELLDFITRLTQKYNEVEGGYKPHSVYYESTTPFSLHLMLGFWGEVETERGKQRTNKLETQLQVLETLCRNHYLGVDGDIERSLGISKLLIMFSTELLGDLHQTTNNAKVMFAQSCSDMGAFYQEEKPETAKTLLDLGQATIERMMRDQPFAETLDAGNNEWQQAGLVGTLVGILINKGLYEKAQHHNKTVLMRFEQFIKQDGIALRQAYHYEAMVYGGLGKDRNDIAGLLLKGIAISTTLGKPYETDAIASSMYYNLGLVYAQCGQHEETIRVLSPFYEQRSKERRKADLNNARMGELLAIAYFNIGNLESAVKICEKVVAEFSEIYSLSSPRVKHNAILLVKCYEKLGNLDEATKLKEAYQIGDD